MQKPQLQTGTGRWICCYWEEKFGQLGDLPRQEVRAVPGVLRIPPPVEDLTFHDGLWRELNSKLGTLFAVGEEEEVPPELLPEMAKVISLFAERHYRCLPGLKTAQIGEQVAPETKPLIAEMPVADLFRALLELSEFLTAATHYGKVIVVSL